MIDMNTPLAYWYEKSLANEDIHMCTSMELSEVDVHDVFVGNSALQFIRSYFHNLRSSHTLKSPASKFLASLDRITEFRAQHTVASFLLGVVVKEELSLDIRNWIKIYGNKSADPTFGFFWSLICLTHDIAYNWERSSKKMITLVPTVEEFCQYAGIRYNLLDMAKNADLIRNYYHYRVSESKIDHGIAGAMLIYDALMTFYNEGSQVESLHLCGLHLRKNFPEFCLRIAETVALHNMWRADSKTKEIYTTQHLDALIPDGNNSELVFYRDDMLLFLLGLIDTIDPIKGFCSTEGGRVRLPVEDVLNNFCIQFVNRGGLKRIYVRFDNPNAEKYLSALSGMESWLGVSVQRINFAEVAIEIRMDSPARKENEISFKSA